MWYKKTDDEERLRDFLNHYLSSFDFEQTIRYCIEMTGSVGTRRQLGKLIESWNNTLIKNPAAVLEIFEEDLGLVLLYDRNGRREYSDQEKIELLGRIGEFLRQIPELTGNKDISPARSKEILDLLISQIHRQYGEDCRLF